MTTFMSCSIINIVTSNLSRMLHSKNPSRSVASCGFHAAAGSSSSSRFVSRGALSRTTRCAPAKTSRSAASPASLSPTASSSSIERPAYLALFAEEERQINGALPPQARWRAQQAVMTFYGTVPPVKARCSEGALTTPLLHRTNVQLQRRDVIAAVR